MKNQVVEIPFWKISYYAGLILWMVVTILSSTTYNVDGIWREAVLLAMALAVVSVFLRGYFYKKFALRVVMIVIMFFFVLSVYRDNRMLHTFLFMVCAMDLELDELLKVHYRTVWATVLFVILSSMTGIIENVHAVRHFRQVSYLGFTGPLAPMLFTFALLSYVAYKKEKFGVAHAVLLAVIDFWLYRQSHVRVSFFVCIGVMAAALWLNHREKATEGTCTYSGMKRILFWLPLAACLFSIGISIVYSGGNKLMSTINGYTNGRWQLQKEAVDTYGISLFGNEIEWEMGYEWGTEYLYVDSAYLKYTMMNGIGFMVLFVIFLMLIMHVLGKTNQIHGMLVFVVIVMYGIFNPQLLYLEYNPFLLFPIEWMFEYWKDGQEEEIGIEVQTEQ